MLWDIPNNVILFKPDHHHRFTIKIIYDIRRPETPAADQRIMHKINRPALIQCLWRCLWYRITHRQTLFAFTAKVQLQQTIDPVNALMIPPIALPAQNLEQLFKPVTRITFCRLYQYLYHRFIPLGIIRFVKIHHSAQQ